MSESTLFVGDCVSEQYVGGGLQDTLLSAIRLAAQQYSAMPGCLLLSLRFNAKYSMGYRSVARFIIGLYGWNFIIHKQS